MAFYLTNNYSEAVARSVSSLAVILTALFLVLIWKSTLERANFLQLFLPGLIYLTTPEVIDKALRAEIDATYSLLVNFSLFSWFYLHEIKQKKVLSYLMAGLFSGLAVLTKTFQALVFFYLAVGPYLFWKKRLGEFFRSSHLLFLAGLSLVLLAWLIPLHFKVGAEKVFSAWLSEYLSAAEGKEMNLSQHLFAYTLGALFSLSPWVLFLPFSLKNPPQKEGPSLNLFQFSLFLFFGAYFFHLLFPGARFRYLLPSLSGFAFLSSFVFLKRESFLGLRSGTLLASLISLVFLAKQAFVYIYYPYHQKNLNYFRKSAQKVEELLSGAKTLYLCEAIPHHLIYYLRYRNRVVEEIIYLKNCEDLPKGYFALAPRKSSLPQNVIQNFEIIPLIVRSKEYIFLRPKDASP